MATLTALTPGVVAVPKPGATLPLLIPGTTAATLDPFTRLVVLDPDAGTDGHPLVELATLGGGATYLADPDDIIVIAI